MQHLKILEGRSSIYVNFHAKINQMKLNSFLIFVLILYHTRRSKTTHPRTGISNNKTKTGNREKMAIPRICVA